MSERLIKENAPPYRGRFAPSPTGSLHFGSLIAALGSYLEARRQQGEWHVRIDDIDPPRELPGAADDILRSLESFGFEWDGAVIYQSRHLERFEAACSRLMESGLLYACACSRKEIAQHPASADKPAGYYPGICRKRGLKPAREHALRIRVPGEQTIVEDLIQGEQTFNLADFSGDFVLRRNDGLFSYQLASAVDDALDGYTDILRGADLMDSTPRQIYIQQALGYAVPRYGHLPVAINADGQKLSKQNLAPALRPHLAAQQIWQALHFLGQNPPAALRKCDLRTIWEWGLENWTINNIPRQHALSITQLDFDKN